MHIRKNLATGKFELVDEYSGKVLLTLDTLSDLDDLANAVLPNRSANRVNPAQYRTINGVFAGQIAGLQDRVKELESILSAEIGEA